MESTNKDFIRGGLPLSTADFVDKKKAQEGKNKLLIALENINNVHNDKMATASEAVTKSQNFDAVGITLDMLDKDNSTSVGQPVATRDQYILESQIERYDAPEPKTEENDDNPEEAMFFNTEEQPSFDQFEDEPSPPMFEENQYTQAQPEQFNESMDLNNTFDGNQGEPMIVLDDQEFGKKSKKAKAGKTNKSSSDEVKSGRGVAWLAYILFFIPLIFMRKNTYVRHHANEGLEINIVDIIGLVLFLVSFKELKLVLIKIKGARDENRKFVNESIKIKAKKGNVFINTNVQVLKYKKIKVNLQDVIEFQLVNNQTVVDKSGIGESIVGGMLFGGAGAIAGAMVGKKQKTKDNYKLFIRTKDVRNAGIVITLKIDNAYNLFETLKLVCTKK